MGLQGLLIAVDLSIKLAEISLKVGGLSRPLHKSFLPDLNHANVAMHSLSLAAAADRLNRYVF
jgi:hypothetical protein